MVREKYKSSLKNANYRAWVWMLFAGGLLFSNVLLAIFVIKADTSEKTIITPPVIDQPFWVQGDEVSKEYIEQMARYFSQLLLTYHKANAARQFESVLQFADPTVYNQMKARLLAESERISRNDLGSVFYLMGIHIKKHTAIVNGELVGMIGQQVVSRKQKYYEISFNYRNGNLYVDRFSEVKKDYSGKNYVEVEANSDFDETSESNMELGEGGI